MGINLELPKLTELKPRIVVIGVGGAGGNAINNMIASGLGGVEYVAANTDAQALVGSSAESRIQLGINLTEGLGAGSKPEIGEAAAEEAIDEIRQSVVGAHMVFIAAGMGGGTGTGAASVIARVAREVGVLTVGIVTKPFLFEGTRRQRTADTGIEALRKYVDTMIVIPNQNLFRIATEKTTFAEAFVLADQVLYSGVACIVDLIVKDGLINLDFADVRTIMSGMGTAMMGTGEATGERRALRAAEDAISNPLLDEVTLKGAKGVLLSIIGGRDMTLYEVDEAASRVRQEVDPEANIIVGATFDEQLGERIRVAIVASGIRGDRRDLPAERTPSGAASQAAQSALPPPAPGAAGRSTPPVPPAQNAASRPPVPAPDGLPPPAPPFRPPFTKDGDAGGWLPPATAVPHPSPKAEIANAAARGEPVAAPDVPRELWRAPGNVVIEEAAVPRLQSPASRTATSYAQPSGPPVTPADPFMPSAPEDVRRASAGRRMPEIDEFPAVGQRDYRAKTARYESPPATAGVQQPQAESRQRGGMFNRMMGGGPGEASSDGSGSPLNASEKSSRKPSFFRRNRS